MALRFWGNETLVNTALTGNQTASSSAVLLDGTYVVLWADATDGLLKFQRYGAGGNTIGGQVTVPSQDGTGLQDQPTIAALDNGGFIIGVRDYDSGTPPNEDHDTAAFVYATGSSTTPTAVLLHGTIADTSGAIVEARSGGGWAAVFTDMSSSSNFNVKYVVYDAAGTKIVDTVAHTAATGNQGAPQIDTWNPDPIFTSDRTLIAWTDSSAGQLRASYFVGNGTAGDEFTVYDGGGIASAASDAVCGLSDNTMVVAYAVSGALGGTSYYMKLFDQFGSELRQIRFAEDAKDRQIVDLGHGQFAVVWENPIYQIEFLNTVWVDSNIRLQVFNYSGDAAGAPITVNTSSTGFAKDPGLELLKDGRLLVTWNSSSGNGDTSGDGIYQQIIDPRDGQVEGTDDAANGDTLYGNDLIGDDMHGRAGNDKMFGLNGSDQIFGGDGNDTMEGGRGDDILWGGTGNDNLRGGSGDDDLSGEAGNDVMTGGRGDDNHNGGTGQDTVTYSASKLAVIAALDESVAGTNDALGDTFTGVERLVGSDLAAAGDMLIGDTSANTLEGLKGTDTISGGGGNDKITGGLGADTLTGGPGNDQFIYDSVADFGDTITDFSKAAGNNDVLMFNSVSFGEIGKDSNGHGQLLAGMFIISASNVALDADDIFILRTTDNTLWYDGDANLPNAPVKIADLQPGAVFTIADIVIF